MKMSASGCAPVLQVRPGLICAELTAEERIHDRQGSCDLIVMSSSRSQRGGIAVLLSTMSLGPAQNTFFRECK